MKQANKSRTSTNPSSSQSSSIAGETVEVKVEITPPTNDDSTLQPSSFSMDSNSTLNKTPLASPQPRKQPELSSESLLNPTFFNRVVPTTSASAGGSASRLYKRIEEIIDLSSPYNHYKCLSPSESNLSQFYDGKFILKNDVKPGSTRLLRRQFSLDREDGTAMQHLSKPSILEVPVLQETRLSPKVQLPRLHNQNSTSISQDLEKIEEIPLSPESSHHHSSSLESSLNRTPPSSGAIGMQRSPGSHHRYNQEILLNVDGFLSR